MLDNSTKPNSKGLLPEPEIADMEGFLSEIEVLLPVFAFTEAGTKALTKEAGGEFVVLKDSIARVKETKSITGAAKIQHRQFVEDGTLAKTADGQHYTFTRDVAFPSPSGAASIIYGGNISGPRTWRRDSDGLTYKEWRQRKLAQAPPDPPPAQERRTGGLKSIDTGLLFALPHPRGAPQAAIRSRNQDADNQARKGR